jgi:hypothetical protein
MILDVAYQSQIPFEEDPTNRKWCGLVCLWMVLKFYLKDQCPTLEDLIQIHGKPIEEQVDKYGFFHKDLLKIARFYGLGGFRKSWWPTKTGQDTKILMDKFLEEGESTEDTEAWLKTNIDESVFTISEYVKRGVPVIASVTPEFSPSTDNHLVLIIGEEEDSLYIHDPLHKGEKFKMAKDEFKSYSIRQAIIIRNNFSPVGFF